MPPAGGPEIGKRRPWRLRRAVALAGLALACLVLAQVANAKTHRPHDGRSFFGVSDSGEIGDYLEFKHNVRAHPAVLQTFHTWGFHPWRAMNRWAETNTRGMLSISTTDSFKGTEVIDPK
jgi:hypothetical protein